MRGSNSADTTVIRNTLWGRSQELINPGSLLAIPEVGWGTLPGKPSRHLIQPFFAFLTLASPRSFKDCGFVRVSGLGRTCVGSRRYYHGLGAMWGWYLPGLPYLLLFLLLSHPSPCPNMSSPAVLPVEVRETSPQKLENHPYPLLSTSCQALQEHRKRCQFLPLI